MISAIYLISLMIYHSSSEHFRRSKTEIKFRDLAIDPNEALEDIFRSCFVLSLRGQKDQEHYKEMEDGLKSLKPYVFERYSIKEAIVSSAKTVYLSQLLKVDDEEWNHFNNEVLSNWLIQN